MQQFERVQFLSLIVLVGFFSAVVFHYFNNFYLAWPVPKTFLFEPSCLKLFGDFYPIYGSAEHFDPYSVTPSSGSLYFPFNYVMYYPFTLLEAKYSVLVFLFIGITFFVVFNFYYFKLKGSGVTIFSKMQNIFILSFLSYPFLFSVERANSEWLIYIFCALFLFLYEKKKIAAACFFLVIAIAMKGYVGIFLCLLIFDKRYKAVFGLLIGVACLEILSLLVFKGSVIHQLKILFANLDWFKSYFVQSNITLLFNSSLYALTRVCFNIYHHVSWQALGVVSNKHIFLYSLVAAFSLLSVLLVLLNPFKCSSLVRQRWEVLTALVACTLLFPEASFDYHMLLLYLPIYLFVNSPESTAKKDKVYCIIFGLLLIPKSYYFIFGEYTLNSGVNTILLLILLGCILLQGVFSGSK